MVVCRSSWANVVVSWDHRGDRDRNHFVAFPRATSSRMPGSWGNRAFTALAIMRSRGLGWPAAAAGGPAWWLLHPHDSGSGEVNQLTTIAPSESEGIHKKWTFAFTQSIGLAGSGRRQPAAGGWAQITGVEASAEQTCGIGPRIDDDFKIELGPRGSLLPSIRARRHCATHNDHGGSGVLQPALWWWGAALAAGRTDAPSSHLRRHVGAKIGWHRGTAGAIQTHDQAIPLNRHQMTRTRSRE